MPADRSESENKRPSIKSRWTSSVAKFFGTVLVSVLITAAVMRNAHVFAASDSVQRRHDALVRIGLGLAEYEEAFQATPNLYYDGSTGAPVFSWRYEVCNIIRQTGFGVRADYASFASYRHPELGPWVQWKSHPFSISEDRKTDFVGVDVPGGYFDPDRSSNELPNDLVILIENQECQYHWMEAGDLPAWAIGARSHSDEEPQLGWRCWGSDSANQGVFVLFRDLEAWRLRNDTPADKVRLFVDVEGANENDRDAVLGPYRM